MRSPFAPFAILLTNVLTRFKNNRTDGTSCEIRTKNATTYTGRSDKIYEHFKQVIFHHSPDSYRKEQRLRAFADEQLYYALCTLQFTAISHPSCTCSAFIHTPHSFCANFFNSSTSILMFPRIYFLLF